MKAAGEACDGPDLGGATCASEKAGGLPPGPDGKPLAMGGLGQLSCGASCSLDPSLCDPQLRSIGYLGDAPGGGYQLAESFSWDASAHVYRPSSAVKKIVLPPGTTPSAFPTLLAFDKPGEPLTLPAGAVPPEYPFLRIDEQGQGAPMYDPCWDYACESAPLPPRPKRPARKAPLMLRHTGGDDYVPGTSKPWVQGHGKIRLVVAVAYADSPMPDGNIQQLFAPEGAADSTSLLAVPAWYSAQSKALGLPSPVEVEVVWSKVQIKLPPEQVPQSYDQCFGADWKPTIAPQLALEPDDVLVQFYWGPDGSQCANHVLWGSRSYVLFANPTFFSLPGLVVSGAHELMHLFGASDKYTDTVTQDAQGNYHGCWFENGDDFTDHDIMCHRVLNLGPNGEFGGFENPPLHQLSVSPLTAREVGWQDMDGDGTLELEDACPWDATCP